MKVYVKILQHLLGGGVGLIIFFGWEPAKVVHSTKLC